MKNEPVHTWYAIQFETEKNEIFMMIVACTQLGSVLKLELLENVELSNC